MGAEGIEKLENRLHIVAELLKNLQRPGLGKALPQGGEQLGHIADHRIPLGRHKVAELMDQVVAPHADGEDVGCPHAGANVLPPSQLFQQIRRRVPVGAVIDVAHLKGRGHHQPADVVGQQAAIGLLRLAAVAPGDGIPQGY